jgi:hypothetical protein
MITKFIDVVKRYSGYTRFITPVWNVYVDAVSKHPSIAGAVILILALHAIF